MDFEKGRDELLNRRGEEGTRSGEGRDGNRKARDCGKGREEGGAEEKRKKNGHRGK